MSQSQLLSIIIVSYNTKDLTLATLESVVTELAAHSLIPKTEILIVDNASKDGSQTALKAWRTKTRKFQPDLAISIIENTANTGFATANNQAIELSRGELIFLLNSDTVVLPGAIAKLIQTFSDHPIDNKTSSTSSHRGTLDRLGLLSAQLLNANGSLQPQGGDLPSLWAVANQLLFLDDLPIIGKFLPSTQHTGRRASLQSRRLVQKGWVAATALMVRRETIAEIGPLDDSIFMYGEDVEWCLRAHNHHWDVAIDQDAHITHYGSASSSSSRAILGELKGYEIIWAKHKPLWQRPVLKGIIGLACVLRGLLFGTILQQPKRATPYWQYLSQKN